MGKVVERDCALDEACMVQPEDTNSGHEARIYRDVNIHHI
jgi:hypothetical protein